MENAILVGLSRQMTLQRELEVIANNIANTNTSGFRRDALIFNDYLAPIAKADAFPNPDKRLHYVLDPTTRTDFNGGTIASTGKDLDVALQGDGFFTVQTAAGERYTRAGSFQINAQGTLVTASGDPVLSDGGQVTFAPNETKISISADGTISSESAQHGKLRISRFADPANLRKQGDNLFAVRQGVTVEADTLTRVVQGSIEQSNVRPVVEMSRMIEVNRTYALVSQMIDQTSQLRSSAIQTLGNTSA